LLSLVGIIVFIIFRFSFLVFAVVLGARADALECVETGSSGGIGVDVNHLATLYILEKSHRSVARIILDHIGVILTDSNIKRRMLKDASLTVGTL